jgi:hypothetical protein
MPLSLSCCGIWIPIIRPRPLPRQESRASYLDLLLGSQILDSSRIFARHLAIASGMASEVSPSLSCARAV